MGDSILATCQGVQRAKPLGYVAKPQTRNPKMVQRNAAGSLRVSLSHELPAISSWLIALDEWGTKGVVQQPATVGGGS
jgi:hypothetical protein